MNAIYKNGEYELTYMDQHVFKNTLKKGEIVSWCSRIHIKEEKLTVTVTIGDYIIMEWHPNEYEVYFENRNDPSHGYSKIDAIWVRTVICYSIVNNLMPGDAKEVKPFKH